MTKKQDSSGDNTSLPQLLGTGYAHVQHLMDKAIAWGFKRMEETKLTEEAAAKPMHKAEKIGRGILSFFGSAGNAYYDTYEKLKKEETHDAPGKKS